MSDNTLKILILGAGKMGTAFALGLAANGSRQSEIVVLDPNPADPNGLSQRGIRVCRSAASFPPPGDWCAEHVVCALKPQIMWDALPAYRPWMRGAATFISIAAGFSLSALATIQPGPAHLIRVMPNLPVSLGLGVIGATAMELPPGSIRETVGDLLRPLGAVYWLHDERDLDAITAVGGSGPAYVFQFVDSLTNAAVKLGFEPGIAASIARQTLIGAAEMLKDPGTSATELRESVTSPGGTTESALNTLMDGDHLSRLMTSTVQAAFARARQLGEETA